MIEKTATFLLVIVLTFMAGWYAALHQDRFFSWASGVGTYWQAVINKDCKPPAGYTCSKTP